MNATKFLGALTLTCAVALSATAGRGQTVSTLEEEAVPTIAQVETPSDSVPSEENAEELASQPTRLVYVGPQGSFLLHPGKSRGIFRWGAQPWANGLAYSFADANYYVYRLVGSNAWFAFAKNASGGTFVVWRGVGTTKIVWLDTPQGWMRATRGSAAGNLD